MLKTFAWLFYFECLLRIRTAHEWLYPLGFFLSVMLLFPLAFTPDPQVLQQYVTSFIWIAALLASLLSINHVFATDIEDGYLEQSLLSGFSFTMIVFAKLCAQWLFGIVPLIVLSPVAAVFFHLQSNALLPLIIGLLLGTPIFTLIGSLAVALTCGLKQQGVLLGLIMFPLLIPVLIFGINIAREAQENLPMNGPLCFFAGISVLAITVLPFVIASTLRISLDD